ncbi:MAG: DUF4058 family protein [Planctomycetaceae bacterium]
MPLHDWTRVSAGLFHHFHQSWSIRISDALNQSVLPPDMFALVEQRSGPLEPDVLAIESRDFENADVGSGFDGGGGSLTATAPQTSMVIHTDSTDYARKANRIVVHHQLGNILAVIEIISPGNKDRLKAITEFVNKTVEFLDAGVHVLIIDLFPPMKHDPAGIHKRIWDEYEDQDFAFPAGKSRLLASYRTDWDRTAYLEPLAVGDPLVDMPLFLSSRHHVKVPLESTYQAAWNASPAALRQAVESHPIA